VKRSDVRDAPRLGRTKVSSNDLVLWLICLTGTAPFSAVFIHGGLILSRYPFIDPLVAAIWIVVWLTMASLCVASFKAKSVSILPESSRLRTRHIFVFLIFGCLLFLLGNSFVGKNILGLGDGVGFSRVLNGFWERGPFSTSPFEMTLTTSDRYFVRRASGPPYPQGSHLLVRLIAEFLGRPSVSSVSNIVAGTYSAIFPPFVLALFGSVGASNSRSSRTIVLLSLLFGSALVFDLSSRQIPTAIGIVSAIFAATLVNQAQRPKAKILICLVCATLLMDIHPSAAASMLFLVDYGNFPKLRRPQVLLFVPPVFLALIFLVPGVGLDLLRSFFNSQSNAAFDFQGLNQAFHRTVRFIANYLVLMGSFSVIAGALAGLLGITALAFAIKFRQERAWLVIVVAFLLITSSVSGIPGPIGNLKIFSIFWYSSPSRLVHLWIVLLFWITLESPLFERFKNMNTFRILRNTNQRDLFSLIALLFALLLWIKTIFQLSGRIS